MTLCTLTVQGFKEAKRAGQWIASISNKIHAAEEALKYMNYIHASFGVCAIEVFKNYINREENDYKDFVNLLDDAFAGTRVIIESLIQMYDPPCALHATRIISDIDNTAIENYNIAVPRQPAANDGDLVYGFSDFVKKNNIGNMSITFISARPRAIENVSILNLKEVMQKSELDFGFSITGGSIIALLKYIINIGRMKLSQNGHQALTGALALAQEKIKCIYRERRAFPYSRIIFLGDDTQGDCLAAFDLVTRFPNSIAYIRRITTPEKNAIAPYGIWPKHAPLAHPRVIFHYEYHQLM